MFERPPTNPASLERKISYRELFITKADKQGMLPIGEFAAQILEHVAPQDIASLLDGNNGETPEINLGQGLRFKGASGNYGDMKIHIDDLDEFIRRVKIYYGEE